MFRVALVGVMEVQGELDAEAGSHLTTPEVVAGAPQSYNNQLLE